MEHLIEGEVYISCVKRGSHNKDKFARADKIAREFETLHDKFMRMAEKGSFTSVQAQHAIAVLLMMHTGIRVGNESSAEGYMTKPHPNSKVEPKFVQTYGLTTLLKSHVLVDRKKHSIYINFLGKKSVENSFRIGTRSDLGYAFGELLDATNPPSKVIFSEVTPYTLTKFIKKSVGVAFSPKDLRTMRANLVASVAFVAAPPPRTKKDVKEAIKMIATATSEALNNTPGVCKKSYIDNRLFLKLEELRSSANN